MPGVYAPSLRLAGPRETQISPCTMDATRLDSAIGTRQIVFVEARLDLCGGPEILQVSKFGGLANAIEKIEAFWAADMLYHDLGLPAAPASRSGKYELGTLSLKLPADLFHQARNRAHQVVLGK